MGNRDFEKMHGNGWSWRGVAEVTPTPSHRVGRGGVAREGRVELAGAGMGAAVGARAPRTGPTAGKTLLRLCSR
jgi:hypothetical protein